MIHGNEIYGAPLPLDTEPNEDDLTSSSPGGTGVSGGPYIDASGIPKIENIDTRLRKVEDLLKRLLIAK